MSNQLVPDKFVRVRVSATSVEVGRLVAVDDVRATVETRNGFHISCRRAQIEPVMLVVCDLNGVLGTRRRKNDFLKRPDLDLFVPFLLRNFVVGVWSSCVRSNGEAIVRDVFGPLESQLLFAMFRDECTPCPTPTNPHATVKDLNQLWMRYPQSFDQSNTIIIDDSDEKCSHRFNALCPTPFNEEEMAGARIGLAEVMDTLRVVAASNSLDALRPLMLRRSELLQQVLLAADDPTTRAVTVASGGGGGGGGGAVPLSVTTSKAVAAAAAVTAAAAAATAAPPAAAAAAPASLTLANGSRLHVSGAGDVAVEIAVPRSSGAGSATGPVVHAATSEAAAPPIAVSDGRFLKFSVGSSGADASGGTDVSRLLSMLHLAPPQQQQQPPAAHAEKHRKSRHRR
jgi:hypothetical protein